jgi:uncharacterized protein YihD (DUF1040 family)
MRDPARIGAVLDLLRQAWEASPDLRLGQLVCNLVDRDEQVYQLEEDVLTERLRHLVLTREWRTR